MAFFDLPLEQLKKYKPRRVEPRDFDSFWKGTLAEAAKHPLAPKFKPVDYGLRTLDSFDATFHGYGGQAVKGWFLLPKVRQGILPCVVEYIGYGGGRGFPTDWLLPASCGFAHFIMDTRGQGSAWGTGDTPDPEVEGGNPQYPGFMTRGVLSPETYYYRRVFTDAVRAVEAAQSHPAVDKSRTAVAGGSQGGGISIAAAALSPGVKAMIADVPFLCHFQRATEITNAFPYGEIAHYLKNHRDKEERVFHTLSYFDGVNLGARARAKALFSVGLMDDTCPPSTVFAAYNHYRGSKDIRVWKYNYHEGGGHFQALERLKFLRTVFGE